MSSSSNVKRMTVGRNQEYLEKKQSFAVLHPLEKTQVSSMKDSLCYFCRPTTPKILLIKGVHQKICRDHCAKNCSWNLHSELGNPSISHFPYFLSLTILAVLCSLYYNFLTSSSRRLLNSTQAIAYSPLLLHGF